MKNNGLTLSQKNFHWIYLIGFSLIILQLLNIIPPWFTPTDWGKVIVFRIILAILLFVFLCQILIKKTNVIYIKEKIKSISLLFRLLVLFIGICLLSTIFSQDIHFSLWGNPVRNGGLINLFFYIIFSLLVFLTLHDKNWRKILIFLIFISLIICIIAIFQQLGLFSYYLIPFEFRPISTMGNPILLSLFLVLIIFIVFSFGLKEKNNPKRIFYFLSTALLLITLVFLTQTRGTIFGLIIGAVFFLFAYPNSKRKTKIYAAVILIIIISGMYFSKIYLDSHLDVYKKMPLVISGTIDRTLSIFEGTKIMKSRLSAWKISLMALKERPFLGWGPENFMIGFDKYYDPSLPLIGPDERGVTQAEWWDRAHNIIFDISITTGIPSLLIYFSIFAVLIWELQKVKKRSPENALISHGLQAGFISYFISLLFSFDSVSTYLTFFFLLGYSFHLINKSKEKQKEAILEEENVERTNIFINKLYPYRLIILTLLFLFLIVFLYAYNLKPLWLNKEINIAQIYSEKELCKNGLEIVNKISPHIKGSIIDNYLSKKSIRVIYGCIRNQEKRDEALINQAIKLIKETTNRHPAYLQNWILLGEFTNFLIEEENKKTNAVFISSEKTENLKKEANYCFERAHILSPKRQIVLKNWADTKIITGEYNEAKEKLNKCLNLNSNYIPCIWKMALAEGYSGNIKEFNYFSKLAEEKGYNIESEEALKQLIDMFIYIKDYNKIAENYQKLIKITKDAQKKAQLHASLAAAYLKLGQTEKAINEAEKILDLIPYFPLEIQAQAKKDVEEFLKSLK